MPTLSRFIKSTALGAALLTSLPAAAGPLALDRAIDLAIQNDPWLLESVQIQDALQEESIAAGTLPDPRLKLGAANLPTDTFDTGQEGMTQTTIGITQSFPRGNTLQLASEKKSQLAVVEKFRRENRKAEIERTVTNLWLDIWSSEQSIELIEANRGLFEQLVDVAEAGYASASMGARQQDVIRASLELTRLDDRLTSLESTLAASQEGLREWVQAEVGGAGVSRELPAQFSGPVANGWELTTVDAIRQHPQVRTTEQLVETRTVDLDLARQAYKPEWSISAQYGYREDAPNGQDRADLFSVAVGFDLPIFTGNRQDRRVSASTSRLEAAKSQRLLQVRTLQAGARTALARIDRLDERIRLYQQTLLPQMEEQAGAALSAYNNDDGDFAEAVRARIDQLNANVELIQMRAQRAKHLADFRYLTSTTDAPISSLTHYQD